MGFEERLCTLGYPLPLFDPARTRPGVSLCLDFSSCKMAFNAFEVDWFF